MGDITIGWFGLRELLIAAIAGLWIYWIYSFLRLQQLKRRNELLFSPPQEFREPALGAGKGAPAAQADADKNKPSGSVWEKDWEGRQEPRPEHSQEIRHDSSAQGDAAVQSVQKTSSVGWFEPPERVVPEERIEDAERQIGILRDEVATLRSELAAMRNELWQQMERMKASQHISPIYGDAMQMAASGYDAGAIAERCGITRAEAELIAALGRAPEDE
ncbi:MAG: DUF2802 domain-containing protein [Betaproteobacteria bacterium]|nr:DUF2802 domain-containing protein [Betaproteobacteria bacterium]